jgi:chondroitin 4-sulfotransferase 11
MLRSEQRNFIFIHIQKTAGLSIEDVFKNQVPDLQTWHGRHGRAIDGIDEIGQESWNDYYTFAFVRNPWERLVSWYANIEREKKKLSSKQLSSAQPFKVGLWNYVLKNSHDFDSFIENCTEVIFDLGAHKSFTYNQLDYLSDAAGKLSVDFVGRFEHLADDMNQVFRHIGLNEIKLPHVNKSEFGHYSAWYKPHTREIIAKRFARDIEFFDYKFEERDSA